MGEGQAGAASSQSLAMLGFQLYSLYLIPCAQECEKTGLLKQEVAEIKSFDNCKIKV